MRQTGRETNGSVTVFLAMILMCICALLAGLFESARVAGTGLMMQTALDASLDSLMGCYHRGVWDRYRIFLLECDSSRLLEQELQKYSRVYREEGSFCPIPDAVIRVYGTERLTDRDGRFFREEAAACMKTGSAGVQTDPEKKQEEADSMQEAVQFGAIADAYQKSGRNLVRLERAAAAAEESRRRQAELLGQARAALSADEEDDFYRYANLLCRELEGFPQLCEKLEEETIRLEKHCREAALSADEKQQDLTETVRKYAGEEEQGYGGYLEEREKQLESIRQMRERSRRNLRTVEEAVRKAEEIPEPEEGEEKHLSPVIPFLDEYEAEEVTETGRKPDLRILGIFESIGRMAGGDLLSVCLPEGTSVSGRVYDSSGFPSAENADTGASEEADLPAERILKRALLAEYGAAFFDAFEKNPEKEVFYEQEYLLAGTDSDRENLKRTVNRLIAVREALNLVTILSSSRMRREAELLAASAAGGAGPASAAVSFFLMTVWAFAQSVEDVRILLAGGKVPPVRKEENWTVTLSALSKEGLSSGAADPEQEQSGLSYGEWLKLFFLVEDPEVLSFRMMDMIQNRTALSEPGFRISRSTVRLEAEMEAELPYGTMKRRAVRSY